MEYNDKILEKLEEEKKEKNELKIKNIKLES